MRKIELQKENNMNDHKKAGRENNINILGGSSRKTRKISQKFFLFCVSNLLWSLVLFSFCVTFVNAEGSKELVSSGGDRPFLDYTDALQAGLHRRTIIKTFIKVGESLNVGSSANGLGTASIKIIDPNGKVYTSNGANGIGVINNNIEEQAGPLPNLGGYKPFTIVSTTTDGTWTIEFHGPVTTNTASGNNYTATQAWTRSADQPTDQAQILAWDATVRDINGKAIPGRIYTNALAATMRNNSRSFSSLLYVLTKEGWIYDIDANGMDPFGFIFLSNNRGNELSNGNPSYRSREGINAKVHDPETADTTTFTHKIFFNPPDTSVYKTIPPPPVLTNFHFVGAEGTPGATGYGMGGKFVFDTDQTGRYKIKIDANGNGSTTDPVDITLDGDVASGTNAIAWNGKDGLGNYIPPGTIYSKAITLEGVFAEVHFPLYDAESNPSGFIMNRINGIGSPDDVLYYDDRDFTDTTSFQNQMDGTVGAHSTNGLHKWTASNGSGKGGDTRVIDTWGKIQTAPIQIDAPITIRTASLYIKRTYFTPSTLYVGNDVTFYTDVVNDGPNDLKDATFFNQYPQGLYQVSSVPCSSTLGSQCSDAFTISNGVLTGLFDIKKGETVTIGVTGKFTAPVGGTGVTDVSGVLRAPDFYDPQATAIAPPPNFLHSLDFLINQCVASGYLTTVCDNMATLNIAKVGTNPTPPQNPYPLPTPTPTPQPPATTTKPTVPTTPTSTTTKATSTLPTTNPTPNPIPEPPINIPTINKNPRKDPLATTTQATTTEPVVIKKIVIEESTTTTDFPSEPMHCDPYLLKPVNQNSSAEDVNKVKNILQLVSGDSLYLDGKYDDALIQSVKEFQQKNLHKLTILKAGGFATTTGIVDKYTMGQMNVDFCLARAQNLRCPYFFDYLTQGDKNGTKNKLQESTTTQVDVWKEFLNLLFPGSNLKYNGIDDAKMKKVVGQYHTQYRRTILQPWKYANPSAKVTYYLREASRNWANYMVNCPEGPIELYDGSGNVDYR